MADKYIGLFVIDPPDIFTVTTHRELAARFGPTLIVALTPLSPCNDVDGENPS